MDEEYCSYSFSITENIANNTFVGEVRAADADSESLGKVIYSLSSTEEFYITKGGKLFTKGLIDRETRSFYTLRVTAIDGGKYRS